MKKISFTLFGNNPKYYVGAEKNLEINQRLLPDWTNVIYYHKNNVRHDYIEKLSNNGATMIDVSDLKISGKFSIEFPYFWRFFTLFDEGISLVRDLDSRFSLREVEYIKRWENSNKKYFIIRDHPWHAPVPSGLLGFSGQDLNFKNHFDDFIGKSSLRWGEDQEILYKYFVNINKEDIFYCGYDDETNYIPRDDKNFFIGMQIDEFENPLNPSAIQALDYLKSMNI